MAGVAVAAVTIGIRAEAESAAIAISTFTGSVHFTEVFRSLLFRPKCQLGCWCRNLNLPLLQCNGMVGEMEFLWWTMGSVVSVCGWCTMFLFYAEVRVSTPT